MRKLQFFVLLFFVILSCRNSSNKIEGSWIQPIPGQTNKIQGFRLDADGKASSINMYTLKYESWELVKGYLILTGKSFGNSQIISFTDTFAVKKLDCDTLVLRKGELNMSYSRLIEGDER